MAAAIPAQQPEPRQSAQATQGLAVDAGKLKRKPKLPRSSVKPQALPKAKLTLSEAGKPCSICGQAQFRDHHFGGCKCFQSLAKSAAARPVPGGYEITFGAGWSREGILTLIEAMR